MSEYEVSWLIYWTFRAEQRQESLGPALGVKGPERPIRDYMKNMFHGSVDDPFIDRALGIVDMKTVLWGSDFPHPRCTYPNSEQVVKKAFGNLPPDVQEDITRIRSQIKAVDTYSLLGRNSVRTLPKSSKYLRSFKSTVVL